MEKSLALPEAVAAAALPMSAPARRAWLSPVALSGMAAE
jgi:hypothetical protein